MGEFDLISVTVHSPHHFPHQRSDLRDLPMVLRVERHLPGFGYDVILLVVSEDLAVALCLLHLFLVCKLSLFEKLELLRG